jgi:hypothetical protein
MYIWLCHGVLNFKVLLLSYIFEEHCVIHIEFSGSDTLKMDVRELEYCGAEICKMKSPSYM